MKLAKYLMKKLKRMAINMLFLRIAVWKISNILKKHPCEMAFFKKVAGYLTLTGNDLLGNLCNFKNSFHKKHL